MMTAAIVVIHILSDKNANLPSLEPSSYGPDMVLQNTVRIF